MDLGETVGGSTGGDFKKKRNGDEVCRSVKEVELYLKSETRH